VIHEIVILSLPYPLPDLPPKGKGQSLFPLWDPFGFREERDINCKYLYVFLKPILFGNSWKS